MQDWTKIKMLIIKYNIKYKYNGDCPGRKLPVKYFIKHKYIKINKNNLNVFINTNYNSITIIK